MKQNNSVKKTLSNSGVHMGWEKNYRNDLNEKFFKLAFDYVIPRFNAPKGAKILDAGCGSAKHTIRLAEAGFKVVAADYSAFILDKAKENIQSAGFGKQVTFQQEDLTSLTFKDNSFEYVLCWGVLMHIPDIESAIKELCRVLEPGGKLIISEVNMRSFDIGLRRVMRCVYNKNNIKTKRVTHGLESWMKTESGELLSRQLDMAWAAHFFEQHGVKLVERRCGQFTEMYTKFPAGPIQSCLHGINNFWFKSVKLPFFACGNILVFEKS